MWQYRQYLCLCCSRSQNTSSESTPRRPALGSTQPRRPPGPRSRGQLSPVMLQEPPAQDKLETKIVVKNTNRRDPVVKLWVCSVAPCAPCLHQTKETIMRMNLFIKYFNLYLKLIVLSWLIQFVRSKNLFNIELCQNLLKKDWILVPSLNFD